MLKKKLSGCVHVIDNSIAKMERDKSSKEAKKQADQNEKSKETDDEIPTSTKTLVLKAPKIPTSIQR